VSVTLTLEQMFAVLAGLVFVGGVLWRVRPYVQGEVSRAVEPLRTEFHAWREESQHERAETRATLDQILSTIQPMHGKIDANEKGNKAGKAGIVQLSGDVGRLDKRTHNLEIKAGFVDLGTAAADANGTAA
jgi:hypothetical protein